MSMSIKEHAKIVLGAGNVQDLHDLRSALFKVMGGGLTDKDSGICFNWSMPVTGPADSCTVVRHFPKGWPQHNGLQNFPIKEAYSNRGSQ